MMQFAQHGNGKGLDDLYILPETDEEHARIIELLEKRARKYEFVTGDESAGTWSGRRFFDVPFGESLRPEVEHLMGIIMSPADVLKFRGPRLTASGEVSVNAYQHQQALEKHRYTSGFGRPLRMMVEGWSKYAREHLDRYEDRIGNDGYSGDVWATIGKALLQMLDCDLGGWDAGSLSHNINEYARQNGVDLVG